MALYMKNPQIQRALLSANVDYDNAPAVTSTAPFLRLAQKQAAGYNAGANAQRKLNNADATLGLKKRILDFNTRRASDSMNLMRQRFSDAKKSGNIATGLSFAGLGISGLSAYDNYKKNLDKLKLIRGMTDRANSTANEYDNFISQLLKLHYGA